MRVRLILPGLITSLLILVAFAPTFVYGQSRYPETTAVLQNAYQREIRAHLGYLAYAEKARDENYPNIAHLFKALAYSESIHARNFNEILSELGGEVKGTATSADIKIGSTKENLRRATALEIEEIDYRYPEFLERIKPEEHEEAIRRITYAWESEKQHRDLIAKLQSGTGVLFPMMAGIIEKTPRRYFVCQFCGSTIQVPPQAGCVICKRPSSDYQEIEKSK